MSKSIIHNHIRGASSPPLFNVSKVRAMSDKETEKRAKDDPDAPLITQEDVRTHRVKKITQLTRV